MNARAKAIVLTASGALLATGAALADDSFGKDLMATIALQGKPCDQVIGAKRNGDSDYVATCKDGHKYHVYVNAQGRVIVEKA
jgi:hypothetical protein